MRYEFHSGKELYDLCCREGLPISEVMLRNEMEQSDLPRDAVIGEMMRNLAVMRESIQKGLDPGRPFKGVFIGGDAVKVSRFAPSANMGKDMAEIVAAAMAVVEVNASMGKIVAAPTAGASGILPAVVITCGDRHGSTDETMCMALFTAGAIGCIIAENASIAGASGGCQAEAGSAAAMAAAALAELDGGDPETCLHAAAIALKNILGLVCDPIGGLVECPCEKRNAIGAANAVLSCDLALAGVQSLIPFDEVVAAMDSIGRMMHSDLRETARGGLAATPTAQILKKKLSN